MGLLRKLEERAPNRHADQFGAAFGKETAGFRKADQSATDESSHAPVGEPGDGIWLHSHNGYAAQSGRYHDGPGHIPAHAEYRRRLVLPEDTQGSRNTAGKSHQRP